MFRQFFRLIYITYVLMKYGIDQVLLSTKVFHPFRFLSYLNPFNWFRRRSQTRGECVRLTFEALGPVFVKFGQTLSTRRDLISGDVIDELEKLVDSVPGYPGEEAKKIIETAYGFELSGAFLHFDIEPMASASIAQVHKATLLDGTDVAVKVVRPKIRKRIYRDIPLMYTVARALQRFWPEGERLKPVELVREFEKTILDELDMMREGANASQLRRNFQGSDILYVPEVFWNYTRHNVLVTELLVGVPITNVNALKASKMNMKKLAENGVEIFFTQVFRDSFFHADMHRGNIFISTENKDNPKYMAVDFGIMGVLSPTDQRYLAENLLAFFKRDYLQVAKLHVQSGWVPPETRIEEFESAMRSVCEPVFEKPLSEISFGKLLLRLFQTASRFQMEVQPQLLLLQKTLLSVEGLGRQLYPELDLWSTAKPFLEKWMKDRISAKTLLINTMHQAPFWAEKLTDVPDMLYRFLQIQTDTKLPAQKPVQPPLKDTKSPWPGVGLVLIFVAALSYFISGESQHTRQLVEISVGGLGALMLVLGWVYR